MRAFLVSAFLFFLLAPFCMYAQQARPVYIYQPEGKQPIAFANIALKGTQKGTYSDENGQVLLHCSAADTLLISAIGFEARTVSCAALPDTLFLQRKILQLAEVVVTAKIKKRAPLPSAQFGFYDHPWHGSYTTIKQMALYIKNLNRRPGIVDEVYISFSHVGFVVRNAPQSKPYRIRIRVYKPSLDGEGPGDDLLLDNVIYTIDKKTKKLAIPLYAYNLPFKEEGVYVGVDYLGYFEGETFIPYDSDRKGSSYFAPRFSTNHTQMLSYTSTTGEHWQKVRRETTGYTNFNFGIKVAYLQ